MASNPSPPQDYAEGWRPQSGDTVTGTIVALDIAESAYGRYPVVTIARKDGTEVAVHAFHEGLRSRLSALRPVAGEHITVHYHGTQETRSGRTFHRYDARVEGRDVDIWTVLDGRPPLLARESSPWEGTKTTPASVPAVSDDDIPF